MKVALLNNAKINISSIDNLNKDSEFFCVNSSCNCKVIVAAFESTEVNTYFRAKHTHVEGCYMEKINNISGGITRKKITNISPKWTLEDIYNLMSDVELDDPVGDFLTMRELEISSRNENITVDLNVPYFIFFTPTKIENDEQKCVIFGKLDEKRITVSLDRKLDGFDSPSFPNQRNTRILLVSKTRISSNDSNRYIVNGVTPGNYIKLNI